MAKRKATKKGTKTTAAQSAGEPVVNAALTEPNPTPNGSEPKGEGRFVKRCPIHGLVRVHGGRVSKCPIDDCQAILASASDKPASKPHGKPGRKPGRPAGSAAKPSVNGSGGSLDAVRAAARFIHAAGGLEAATEAFAAAATAVSEGWQPGAERFSHDPRHDETK